MRAEEPMDTTQSRPEPPDPRQGLARALAETHLECQSAEHDLGRVLNQGADFCRSRYGAHRLEAQPEHLDSWVWHQQAMADAQEKGGLMETPALPYQPALPAPATDGSPGRPGTSPVRP